MHLRTPLRDPRALRLAPLAAALRLAVLAAALVAVPLALRAQPGAPRSYTDAVERLTRGDTTGAVADLREATRRAPDFGPAYLRLGSLLAARAGEKELDYEDRMEAERALGRAFKLLGENPEVLLEQGLLKRRQQERLDAKRILDRAWAAADREAAGMPPTQVARLHLALGMIYEAWWEDWDNLVNIPPSGTGKVHCGELAGRPLGIVAGLAICPETFGDLADGLMPISERKSEEFRRMLTHFRLAAEADPTNVEAVSRVLTYFAEDGDWPAVVAGARALTRDVPQSPRGWLVLGLGLHELRRGEAADSAFTEGIARLSPDDRRVFRNIGTLLQTSARKEYEKADSVARAETERILFTRTEPLFIDGTGERRREHYARLAWADLKFGEPAGGRRGWDTDRGAVWLRYGRPWKVFQCCYGNGERTIYWGYGRRGPVFSFYKRIGYRRAPMTDPTTNVVRELALVRPEMYQPAGIEAITAFPSQLARFRGATPGSTRFELYAANPGDSLRAAAGEPIETGLFFFDDELNPVFERRATEPLLRGAPGVVQQFEAMPGRYLLSLEARRAADTLALRAARSRVELRVDSAHPGRIAMSDLLLVHGVEPVREPPRSRDDLRIAPRFDTDLHPGDPLELYFEVYGLRADADGIAHYDALLAVEDVTRRGLVATIVRQGRDLLRAEPEPRARWRRELPVQDDAAVDYLRIEMPNARSGEYLVTLTLTDPATGVSASSRRSFRIVPRD